LDQRMTALIGLQNCDNRIMDIQVRKEKGPLRIQEIKEVLNEMDKRLEEEIEQLEESKRERRQVERDIEDIENRIGKSNEKLTNIKSNKEYQAALKEIDGLGAKKSLMEDKVIDIMEEIEMLEKENITTNAERDKLEEEFEEARDEMLEELKALDQDLVKLEKERERFSRDIDSDLLKIYDRIRKYRRGVAISPVIKGICQACHMGIPPQKFNELIRGEEMMNCPNCMRIIYWGEDEGLKGVIEKS
jgi:predicted  nucleic acid-binding Zn-ribbon protein